MIYAQIRKNVVRFVVEQDAMPLGEDWYDVSTVDPTPAVGDIYNPADGTFGIPPSEMYLRITSNKANLANNGTDEAELSFKLYNADGNAVIANKTVRIVFRDSDGAIWDIWWVTLVNGEGTAALSTTRPGTFLIVSNKDSYLDGIGATIVRVNFLLGGNGYLTIGSTH